QGPSLDLRLLHEIELGSELDLVGQRRLPVGERHVPVEAELGPVDRRLELEDDALASVGVGDRPGDRARQLDRLLDALDRDDVAELAAEGASEIVDLESDRGMNRVQSPGSERQTLPGVRRGAHLLSSLSALQLTPQATIARECC